MRLITIILCMCALLALAAFLTIELDPTLRTYDKAEARAFIARCDGHVNIVEEGDLMILDCEK